MTLIREESGRQSPGIGGPGKTQDPRARRFPRSRLRLRRTCRQAPPRGLFRPALTILASAALHLAIAAFFILGPGRHAASVLLSGIRDTGAASIGDASQEKAGSDRKAAPQQRAISVVLTPPPPSPAAKAPSAPSHRFAAQAPDRRPATAPKPRAALPVVAAAAAAKPADATRTDGGRTTPAAQPADARRTPPKPSRQRETAQRQRTLAKPQDKSRALTFRQPFLLPASGSPGGWRGALTGSAQGDKASTTAGTADKGSGDAAVSNYPGRIARKLNGALRYPSGAKAARLTGEATVSFAVDGSGRPSSISIVASSGFDVLDKAAMEAVRRASPFPPIPSAAGRKEWPFTVTLAFGK